MAGQARSPPIQLKETLNMLAVDTGTNLSRYQGTRDEIKKKDPKPGSTMDLADTFDCYMIGILSAICSSEQWDDAMQSATKMINEHIIQKEVSQLSPEKTTLDETESKTDESDDEEESEDSDEESE